MELKVKRGRFRLLCCRVFDPHHGHDHDRRGERRSSGHHFPRSLWHFPPCAPTPTANRHFGQSWDKRTPVGGRIPDMPPTPPRLASSKIHLPPRTSRAPCPDGIFAQSPPTDRADRTDQNISAWDRIDSPRKCDMNGAVCNRSDVRPASNRTWAGARWRRSNARTARTARAARTARTARKWCCCRSWFKQHPADPHTEKPHRASHGASLITTPHASKDKAVPRTARRLVRS